MKITTLIENTSIDENLIHEHGLSLLIETDNKKILFDTGQSGRFLDNVLNMGINLDDLDFIILSHGHYDHGGGLKRILESNKKVKVYLNKNAFGDYYHNERYIGLDKSLQEYSDRYIFTEDNLNITDNISLSTMNNKSASFSVDNFNLLKKENEEFLPDDFHHEQYLEVTENGKRILISGCSHKGILNLMNWYKPDILIGGFHLMEVGLDEKGKEKLNQIAQELNRFNTNYYTCHCTGKKQYAYLKDKMKNLHYLSTGNQIEI